MRQHTYGPRGVAAARLPPAILHGFRSRRASEPQGGHWRAAKSGAQRSLAASLRIQPTWSPWLVDRSHAGRCQKQTGAQTMAQTRGRRAPKGEHHGESKERNATCLFLPKSLVIS